MLKVFTSFSGYDSQCMALDRLGIEYELVGWSEIDRFAIQAHNAVYPQWADRNLGDICKIDWSEVGDFDLFTYSSPCQDFSSAGLQKGGEKDSGTRSSLLWECEKAISIKRPEYLLMENVAALVSDKFIKFFNRWQRTLEHYGYTNFVKVLNAADYGVPQHRERVFMVSILDCDRAYYFPKPVKLERRLRDVLERNVDERYYLSDERIAGAMKSTQKEKDRGNGFAFSPKSGDDVACTVQTTQNRKTDNYIRERYKGAETDRRMAKVLSETNAEHAMYIDARYGHTATEIYPTITTRTDASAENWLCVEEPTVLGWTRDDKGNVTDRHPVDVANCVTEPCIAAMRGRSDGDWDTNPHEQRIETREDGMTNTITSVQKDNMVVCDSRIRKFTERECFRLMDVSEADIDKIQASGVSRSQQYKMAGNSICVCVLAAIFEKLFINTEPENDTQLTIF